MENTAVKYAPGMRIIVRGEEWKITKVEINSLGNQTLHVVGLSQLVKDYESMFMVDAEKSIEVVNPANVKLVPDDSAFFRKSKVYIESQWREKIPTDNKIHIGDKAAMDLMPYQLEPAQMALNKTRQRILIADTVGLGKTLEAGILMSELIVRGKGKRILVVTVKSMMTQFQKEMWNRFTIPLVRLDSAKIQSIRAKLPSNYNPFFYYDKTIISIDTLKNDLEYRTHLENAWWDIIVIDEAHNVAKRGDRSSQRSKLASLLANRSDTLIMLTATPHDGKGQSVASLMNMLDPTAIADEENYTKEDIEGLLIRRFKKDIQNQVLGSFKERVITIERCPASKKEEYAYDIFANMQLQMDQSQTRGKGILFKTSLEKSLFSSPAACIKSIDTRIKKLEKKYTKKEMPDITKLQELKDALEKITPSDFSRYTTLLNLLRSKEYGWTPKEKDDRLVIFTERIETMRYLAENLKKDLQLRENQLEVMHGGMSDKELQRIVDEFGRAESPIRVIVASDVASEGINLHYLSHRLIHFDIPWSLMVFQQRNGRIDRYGQKEQPDIRYMLIDSENPKIKGDARIMEILVQKEEQALKNIGDPAVLLGKFNQEEEEEVTAKAIENGKADAFGKLLDDGEAEFDPLEMLMGLGDDQNVKVEYSDEETLFSDFDYVKNALDVFTDTEEIKYADLSGTKGIEIKLTDNVKRKISKLMPPEAMPSDDYLRLSPDKEYCMKDMQRCMQNELAETAWPATQYLWKLHPIFQWIEDKASVFYKRNEVPVLGLPNGLSTNEMIFLVEGQIPNRKSTTVVDEWFGVFYQENNFVKILTMDEVMQKTHMNTKEPNKQLVSDQQLVHGQSLLQDVVLQAKKVMEEKYSDYKEKTEPYIYDEMERLMELEERHKDAQLSIYDLNIAGMDRRKSEKEREIEKIFENFMDWERDTLEIVKENPYIRIIAAVTGVH
ncbi:MAG: DEAD/DEAH box helicase [Lachnospiraceae bacterium]